jgi:periplasmic nitrate reductase NapE
MSRFLPATAPHLIEIKAPVDLPYIVLANEGQSSEGIRLMADLSQSNDSTARNGPRGAEKRREWLLFLFLTVVLAPTVAVAVVGGYGFLVWMYQLIAGPPGPPAL